MTSQLVIFRAFFFSFFHPLDPKSEKNPLNQLIKFLYYYTYAYFQRKMFQECNFN